MATPVSKSYQGIAGEVIYAGSTAPIREANSTSATWPPLAAVTIPAVGGIDAPLHPKVLDTGSPGWNGYRYWMAFTPYPTSNDDTKENPSMCCSNDGDTWVALATNPIEPAPSGTSSLYYNSDTHLILKDNTLHLIWRLYDNRAGLFIERLLYKTSTDGVTWSASQLMNLETSTPSQASVLLSPAVEYHNGEFWCWTFNRIESPIFCELRKSTSLSGPWSDPVRCTLLLADSLREPWHLDVVRIKNGWAMLISDRKRSDATKGRLWIAYASHAGLVWDARATAFSTASPNIYRSSLVKNGAGFDCWLTNWDARNIRRLRIDDAQVS